MPVQVRSIPEFVCVCEQNPGRPATLAEQPRHTSPTCEQLLSVYPLEMNRQCLEAVKINCRTDTLLAPSTSAHTNNCERREGSKLRELIQSVHQITNSRTSFSRHVFRALAKIILIHQ